MFESFFYGGVCILWHLCSEKQGMCKGCFSLGLSHRAAVVLTSQPKPENTAPSSHAQPPAAHFGGGSPAHKGTQCLEQQTFHNAPKCAIKGQLKCSEGTRTLNAAVWQWQFRNDFFAVAVLRFPMIWCSWAQPTLGNQERDKCSSEAIQEGCCHQARRGELR